MFVSEDTKVRVSKTLSWVLRHGALKEGFNISTDGWVKVEDILKRPKYSKAMNLDTIKLVVEENSKKRFELKQEIGCWFIRAVQGHSIKEVQEEGLMTLIADSSKYPVVVHGSYAKNWDSIYKGGLSKMGRNHVHMAPGYPSDGQVISGMRGSCNLYIEIDIAKAMADGIKFYLSKNNVILSDGMDGSFDKKYFKRVIQFGKVIYPVA